jgi:hypothetical protein
MEGQIFIRKIVQGFDNGTSQYLLGTHTIGPIAMGDIFSHIQILQNPVADDWISTNDVADDFQLFALCMVCYLGHQGHLLLPFFAHFGADPFSIFVVILTGCAPLI